MLGSFGFDASGMDRSIAAGDDFFGFANGTWVKNTEIPADRSRFGSFNVIAEKTLADTRAILEGPQHPGQRRRQADRRLLRRLHGRSRHRAARSGAGAAAAEGHRCDRRQGRAGRALGGDLRADVDLLNATNFYTDRLFGLWCRWTCCSRIAPRRTWCRAAWACPTAISTWAMAAWPNCASSTRPTSHRCCSWPASPTRPARRSASSRWKRRSRKHMPPRKKPTT